MTNIIESEISKIKSNFHSFDGILLRNNEKFLPFMDPTYFLMLKEYNDPRIGKFPIYFHNQK